MTRVIVGANILNIITESLYDKPIVVFREYVQNSIDSIAKVEKNDVSSNLCSKIDYNKKNQRLYFIDNGNGIKKADFFSKMKGIANSTKSRSVNVGYKGIGRLSGIPYCNKIYFVNILSYKNEDYQLFCIDGDNYNKIKYNEKTLNMSIETIINEISSETTQIHTVSYIQDYLKTNKSMYIDQDKGFLVVLDKISFILQKEIENKDFINEMQWLLPVDYDKELYDDAKVSELFTELANGTSDTSTIIPAMAYKITYNGDELKRPIKPNMLRTYTCKTNIANYGVIVHTFSNNKIEIDRKNIFTGIKVYIDNILLCNEVELIQVLTQNGFLNHSSSEIIQSIKGIGAMVYITDKVNISANARRTFIDIPNTESIEFLKLLAAFIENIRSARYALSQFRNSEKRMIEESHNQQSQNQNEITKNSKLKETALQALNDLAQNEISIEINDTDNITQGKSMSPLEVKKWVKQMLDKYVRDFVNSYIRSKNDFDSDKNVVITNFEKWLKSKIHK